MIKQQHNGTDLFVYLDGFLVFLHGGRVLSDLHQALVGAARGLLALEVVRGDLIVLDDGLHVGHVVLEQLGHSLVMLGSYGEPGK